MKKPLQNIYYANISDVAVHIWNVKTCTN